MKCVITRDNSGVIEFWPLNTCLKKDSDGEWGTEDLVDAMLLLCQDYVKIACKLLGFTPRKGSKQLVEITVKKIK
jgi:hypothetical protein